MYGKVAVAFSGGLSSAFLLRTALHELGMENVLAVTVISRSIPEEERLRAQTLVKEWRIPQVHIETDFWKHSATFNSNRDIEYRKDLYDKIVKVAEGEGFDLVLDGCALDESRDRSLFSGADAMIVQPLVQAGLAKSDLRAIALSEGWTIYDVPHDTDLISRFKHDREITAVDLERINRAETMLRNIGFSQVRVRDHGEIARVEINPAEWERLNDPKLRELIYIGLKQLGFAYSTIDMKGYRPDSMNEIHNTDPQA